MSENINFIPATELPEAEGDEVSVLCVENGELKQKAASGLGGGGGGALFSVNINLGDTNWGNPSSIAFDRTFEEIVKAMESGMPVIGWVAINQFTGEYLHEFCGGYTRAAFPRYLESDGDKYVLFFPTTPDYVSYWICADGRTGTVSD